MIDYYALLVGRILIGGYFLWNGILFALNFAATAASLNSVHLGIDSSWLAMAVIALEVASGIAIIIGWHMRYFALALALYLLAASALLHNALPSAGDATYFLKNMALVGALLYVSTTSA